MEAYESYQHTGNEYLDIVLRDKAKAAREKGIDFTAVTPFADGGFLAPLDISTLFGNALDNAIESVRKIADPDKRLIHVSVQRQKGFLRIRIENCFEGKIRFENGMPVTSKKDSAFHGYGTKSIRRIAESYGGSMTIHTEGDWFELRVLIPLSK